MTKVADNTWVDACWTLGADTPGIIIEGRNGGTADWNSSDILSQLGISAGMFVPAAGGGWKLNAPIQIGFNDTTTHGFADTMRVNRSTVSVACDVIVPAAGLAKVLERPLKLAARECQLVTLIKPQFEVEKSEVGKGGVVRDTALHERVCGEVRQWLEGLDWDIEGIVRSPITGRPDSRSTWLAQLVGT